MKKNLDEKMKKKKKENFVLIGSEKHCRFVI